MLSISILLASAEIGAARSENRGVNSKNPAVMQDVDK